MTTHWAYHPSEYSVSFQTLLVNVARLVASKDYDVVIITNMTMNRVAKQLQRNIEN
jgi:vacuolar-type H+-ATPase subunit F/Vma7